MILRTGPEALQETMRVILICLAATLFGACAGTDHVYVGPRLDFAPSQRPDYKFPPPKEGQRAGKDVAEIEDGAL